MLTLAVRKERLKIRVKGMYSQKYPVRKTFTSQCGTLNLFGGGAIGVVPSEGTDGSSEMSEVENHSARTSIIDGREQEIVNIHCINKNNLYVCPHV
jgi:hypothetical protein